MEKNKYLVGVYGSLRKTMSNHQYYLSDSEYKGTFSTEPEYTLHSLSAYPGLKLNGNTSIIMEVYEVGEDTLRSLNHLEGYDPRKISNFYDRIEIDTPWGKAFTYIYISELSKDSIVESGDWCEYKKEELNEWSNVTNN
jgi:gamma-glutamylcyclotransferase (GGCT)/AIG2-like uncharacterized protein YtfP